MWVEDVQRRKSGEANVVEAPHCLVGEVSIEEALLAVSVVVEVAQPEFLSITWQSEPDQNHLHSSPVPHFPSPVLPLLSDSSPDKPSPHLVLSIHPTLLP